MNRPPPIVPPYGQMPWPDNVKSPQLSRPKSNNLPGLSVGSTPIPSNVTPTFAVDFAAMINGTKSFVVNTVSALALASPNTLRNFLHIRNSGAQVIYVDFGADATVNSTLRLEPNEQCLYDVRVPQDDIYVISEVGPSRVSFMYGVVSVPM